MAELISDRLLDAGGLQISLAGLTIANAAQSQIAGFFDSDGAQIPNANGLVKLFFGKNLFEAPDALTEQFNW